MASVRIRGAVTNRQRQNTSRMLTQFSPLSWIQTFLLLLEKHRFPPPPKKSLTACLNRGDCNRESWVQLLIWLTLLQSPMYYGCVRPSVGHVTFTFTNLILEEGWTHLHIVFFEQRLSNYIINIHILSTF